MPRKGAAAPSGLVLFDKPAGPSSFAIVRAAPRADGRAGGPRRHARPVRDGPAAGPARKLHEGGAAVRRPAKRYETDVDLSRAHVDGRSRGRGRRGARASVAAELEARLDALRGEVDLKIPAASAVKIGGERAYKLHRRGVAVEMPTAPHDGLRARVSRIRGAGRAVRRAPQLGRLRARGGRGARRPLREPPPHGRRPVRRRGSRSGADHPARARPSQCSTGMKVARSTSASSGPGPRAVALGTFDGVHLGPPARDRGSCSTLDRSRPSSRSTRIRGRRSATASSCSRPSSGGSSCSTSSACEATLVVEFTLERRAARAARSSPSGSSDRSGRRSSWPARTSASADGRQGDLDAPRAARLRARPVPLLEGVSSTRDPRARCARATSRAPRSSSAGRSRSKAPSSPETREAARSASRPRTSTSAPSCSCPRTASTPARPLGHRAAVSIGTNPHYGGSERRVEAFLLDFDGDLYGKRLVVELWQRLRDERAFDSEDELVAQIAARRRAHAQRPRDPSERLVTASFRPSRNLFLRGGREEREAGPADRNGALPVLRSGVPEAVPRRHRPREPRLPGLRLRGLGPRLEPHTTRAPPLRRGSAAAPVRVTTLTPPK